LTSILLYDNILIYKKGGDKIEKKIFQMSEIFKILSNEVRLCILTNLCKNGEKRVNDLQTCANSSQSFVSQQLI
jgi:DNA-binding transcriptional ArsR family regulator